MKAIHRIAALVGLAVITVAQPAETQPIKGWGSGAKGAVIGGGTGAAIGAIVNKKNRAVGAVAGGAVGAAAGYAVGKNGKKRWSPQAKGTAIGAGAAAGAIINKRNRAVGGVVGGVVGGAAGYAIGKHKDNKNKQEAARVAAAERAAADKARAEQAKAEQAESEKAIAHNTKTPANGVTAASANANGQLLSLVEPTQVRVPYAVKDGFLLNSTYGDPSTPYPTSEYRRKSW